MYWIPIHCIAVHSNGQVWIPLEWIPTHSSPVTADAAASARQMIGVGCSRGFDGRAIRHEERIVCPPRADKQRSKRPLAHARSPRDKWLLSRIFYAPKSTLPEISDDHRLRPSSRSTSAVGNASPARRRSRRGRGPGGRPLRQHPARLPHPVETFRRLVWRDGTAVPAGRAPHRGPLPGRPRWFRRQHRDAEVGHVGHHESPRVGGA